MKRILTICLALLVSVAAQAQITLDECRALARANYPEIRQYDLIQQTKNYSLSNARRAWIPQISFTAQATWQTAVPGFPDDLTKLFAAQGINIPGLNKDQYKLQLELSQTLWDGGKSRADKQIAEAEAAASQRSTDVDLYALDGRIDDIYFGILLLQEQRMQTQKTIEVLKSNLTKVESLQRNGVALQSDTDEVQAELLSANQQLSQIEASQDSYKRMLSIFIGQPLDGDALERPTIVEPKSYTSNRPELQLFDAKSDQLAAQEKLLKVVSRPKFGIFAQGYYGYPGMDFFKDMLNSDWSWNALIGVQMTWNFGSYYTKKNSLNSLRTAQKQVEVQRDVFLFNTSLQVTEENGEMSRLHKALADDDQIVVLRKSIREAAESKLRNGVIDTTDLLRKINEEASATIARSAHEIELIKTIYELKHTVNR